MVNTFEFIELVKHVRVPDFFLTFLKVKSDYSLLSQKTRNNFGLIFVGTGIESGPSLFDTFLTQMTTNLKESVKTTIPTVDTTRNGDQRRIGLPNEFKILLSL